MKLMLIVPAVGFDPLPDVASMETEGMIMPPWSSGPGTDVIKPAYAPEVRLRIEIIRRFFFIMRFL